MNLKESTREDHHAAEFSKFGVMVKEGTLSREQYKAWVYCQYEIHLDLDLYLPPAARRVPQLFLDLLDLHDVDLYAADALESVLVSLDSGPVPTYRGALCYVLTGAHLRGGPQNRRYLESAGLPCRHLRFEREDALAVDKYLKELREMPQLTEDTKKVFQDIFVIMEELAEL